MKKRYKRKNTKHRNMRRRRRKYMRLRICLIIGILVLLLVTSMIALFMWLQKEDREEEPYVLEWESIESVEDSNLDEVPENISSIQTIEEDADVPEKCNELYMTAMDDLGEMIRNQMKNIVEYQEESIITISIMGDSISTFKGYIPEGYYDFFPDNGMIQNVSETWWEPIIQRLDLKLYANASSSGATCTGDSTSQNNPQYGCSDFRINALAGPNGKAPDIIIVYMGTNDLLESVPLGNNNGLQEVSEGNIQNFSDAYTLILNKLRNKYPDSLIYCCTITQIGAWGTDTLFVEFTNGVGEGLKASDYNACIRQIAGNKSASVIDLYSCGIEIGNLQNTTSDGVHPNAEGMKCIAEAVASNITDVRSRP